MANTNQPVNNKSSNDKVSSTLWAIKLIWQSSTTSVSWIIVFTILRGITPAGFVIAIRGLINTTTEQLSLAQGDFNALLPWLFIAFAITLIEALSQLALQYFSERLKGDLTLHANDMVMQHAIELDLPYFENSENRETINRVQQDPGEKLYQFLHSSQDMILAGFQAISLMAVLIWLEPAILLAVVVLALPFFAFQWRLARKRYETIYQRSTKRRWTGYFLESLTSEKTVGEVKLLGLGKMLLGRFYNAIDEFRNQDLRLSYRQFFGGSVFTTFSVVVLYLLFARVGYRVVEGDLTIGDLAVFGGAIARLRVSLDIGIRSAAISYEQVLYIVDIKKFLYSMPIVPDLGDRQQDDVRGELKVKNISFRYPGTEKPILRNLSFDITPGETIAIVGENGSGKSTLAKLIIRLYDTDSGTIELDGHPIQSYPIKHLYQHIALLSQNFGRYEASLAENIAYGNWDLLCNDQEAIAKISAMTGVDRMAESFPDGINTPLGRRFGEHDLSGGQWQRLAIARTLARNASILILDEPTSNIDARAEKDLFDAISTMAENMTTIIISHRFSTLRMADRILVMDKGEIVEQGQHEELLQSGGHYAELYNLHEHYRVNL